MARHKTLPIDDSHFSYRWEYADASARTSASGFVASEVGLWARQLDDNSFWALINHSPPTWIQINASGGGRVAELLTYTNTTNKIIGPLTVEPLDENYTNMNVTTGPPQEYTLDYTVREVVGGSAPGFYICISPTSTAPGGGSFSGGNNPGTGIESVLESGDKVRATYTV